MHAAFDASLLQRLAPGHGVVDVRSRENPRDQSAADRVDLEGVALDSLRHVGRARANQHRRAGEPGTAQATHAQTAHRVVLRLASLVPDSVVEHLVAGENKVELGPRLNGQRRWGQRLRRRLARAST